MPSHQPPPADVERLAERRAQARQQRDFATADRLKAEIEALGWKVVDVSGGHRLQPAHPPDIVENGAIRYGSSWSVPSLLDAPATRRATVVLASGAAATGQPSDMHVVMVTADRNAQPTAAGTTELIVSAGPLGVAGEWNAGIRRALGEVVVLAAPGTRIAGDMVGSLADALGDDSVAVVGSEGLASTDLRRWQPAPAGDVDALGPGLLAFRRNDARDRGPLDERFATAYYLAVWWSLVLRDEGADRPRRAVALALDLPRRASAAATPDDSALPDRAARRDFYRLIDRFGLRYDLLREAVRPTAASAKARRPRR